MPLRVAEVSRDYHETSPKAAKAHAQMMARHIAFISLAFTVAATGGAQGTYRQTSPLDPVNLDRAVNACVDFYQFANGVWIKNNPIPPAYSRWGSFNELEEKNQSELTRILERAAADASTRSAANRMLGTYY